MTTQHPQHHEEQEEETLQKLTPQSHNPPANLLPMTILVSALLVAGSILYAGKQFAGLTNNILATKATVPIVTGANPQPTQQSPTPQPPDSGPAQVSVDNDPVLGNKNAPLTIIEFADFECPFCKRSFNDVLPSLKQDYIGAGKLKFVYRDFPLSFHQNAHKEAEAAECARDQGGDSVFFKYHDQIYTKTTSNGTGLALDQLPVIAKSLGLNVSQFQQCLDSGKFKDEVDKDIADGIAAGVSGTPTWFIGKSGSDGVVNGTKIVGAQPYTAFKTAIDQHLVK